MQSMQTYRSAGIVHPASQLSRMRNTSLPFYFYSYFPILFVRVMLLLVPALSRKDEEKKEKKKMGREGKGRESLPTERHSQASPWRRTARARGGSPPSRARWSLDSSFKLASKGPAMLMSLMTDFHYCVALILTAPASGVAATITLIS
ncbi:hypothetical protein V8C40DRAFT_23947 [Trichoderma camerunense]